MHANSGRRTLALPMRDAARPSVLIAFWALALFLVWSNSFLAIGYLLGGEQATARFDWLSLTVARFVPVGLLCLGICLAVWPREAIRLARTRWRRLLLCGTFTVPMYSFALYWGQQHGIPAPIASLETALAPLFLMLLSALFLGERLSKRKIAGFVVALVGLTLIARAKDAGAGGSYAGLVAITAVAPLGWAVYSAVTKPIAHEVPPVLWAYLCLAFGGVPLVLLLPFTGGPELVRLDAPGWVALLYLIGPCTVFGNAAWGWLMKHLPASSVGFTIFLNPPLTTLSKAILSVALPAVFVFRIVPLEWAGGAVVLLGMAIALWPRAVPPSGD